MAIALAFSGWSLPVFAGEVHIGVERLFGLSAFVETNRTTSDFGDFETTHTGFQAQLLGTTTARGDGQDGHNTSALPRLHVDYQWEDGWSLGALTGWVVSAGRREVEIGENVQDPYIYPVRVLGVLGFRAGREVQLRPPLALQFSVGPQLSLTKTSGDGMRGGSTALQLAVNGALVVSPFEHVRLSVGPYADVGFYGRSHQSLQITGVPDTKVTGSVVRHGFGLAVGLAIAF